MLVAFDPAARERPRQADAPPLTGSPAAIARALSDLAEAGADEAILVLDPITEASVRQLRRGARRARRLRMVSNVAGRSEVSTPFLRAQPAGRLMVWPPSTTIT